MLLHFVLALVFGLQQNGAASGAVLDARTGNTIQNVIVTVEGIPGKEARTDLDGVLLLDLPAGTYRLHFKLDNYNETTVDAVRISVGKTTEATTVISRKGDISTTVDVTEKAGAEAATAEAMLVERQQAAVVSD